MCYFLLFNISTTTHTAKLYFDNILKILFEFWKYLIIYLQNIVIILSNILKILSEQFLAERKMFSKYCLTNVTKIFYVKYYQNIEKIINQRKKSMWSIIFKFSLVGPLSGGWYTMETHRKLCNKFIFPNWGSNLPTYDLKRDTLPSELLPTDEYVNRTRQSLCIIIYRYEIGIGTYIMHIYILLLCSYYL